MPGVVVIKVVKERARLVELRALRRREELVCDGEHLVVVIARAPEDEGQQYESPVYKVHSFSLRTMVGSKGKKTVVARAQSVVRTS